VDTAAEVDARSTCLGEIGSTNERGGEGESTKDER
jgi:hypothetical protein